MSEFRRQHWAAAVDRLFAAIKQNFITFLIIAFVGTRQAEGGYFMYVLYATIALTFFSGIGSWYRFKFRVFEGKVDLLLANVIMTIFCRSIDCIEDFKTR